MAEVVYYREGSNKNPGSRVSLAEAVQKDDGGHRARFKQRVLSDNAFFTFSLKQNPSNTSPQQYIKDYEERANKMLRAAATDPLTASTTCLRLYEKGTIVKVRTVSTSIN